MAPTTQQTARTMLEDIDFSASWPAFFGATPASDSSNTNNDTNQSIADDERNEQGAAETDAHDDGASSSSTVASVFDVCRELFGTSFAAPSMVPVIHQQVCPYVRSCILTYTQHKHSSGWFRLLFFLCIRVNDDDSMARSIDRSCICCDLGLSSSPQAHNATHSLDTFPRFYLLLTMLLLVPSSRSVRLLAPSTWMSRPRDQSPALQTVDFRRIINTSTRIPVPSR